MIVINSNLCSSEFQAAFAALERGRAIKRAAWPEGQQLKLLPTGIVGVIRSGSKIAPPWMGPSNDESDATDWQII